MNTHGLRSIAFLAVAVSCLHAARANDKDISDLTVSSANVNRLQSWSLGPTGMRGCLSSSPGPAERFPGEGRISFLHGEFTSTSRQILVVDIGPKTPADGVMQVDDVILGAGGTLFTSDARKSLARAIQEAEKEEHKGILRLTRWRAGKTEEVELKLNVMGTYAATAPYDCPKSKRIFEDACQVLAREPSKDAPYGFWSINGLALLATGDPQYLPVVREYARNLAPRDLHLQGCYPWGWAYNGLFLCEYYLLTRDEEVLHGIREYTMALARGQGMFGTFGHGGSIRTTAGKLHGPIPPYGPVNQSGLGANLAIVMGKKCGIEHPMVDEAIERANGFFGYYVNKGTIPYGEHEPYDYHDNNGKSAMAAVFFAVQGNRVPEARFFAKMATAGYLNREVGHTGQGFSYLWNMMGPNVGGPRAAAAFFKEASWHYDLVRRCDGDFIYDGGEQCGPGFKDEKYFGKARYYGISPAATYVLTYALPLKKLCITGRESKPETWLSENDVSEAIASGRFHLDRATKTPKELVAALGDWSPVVRGYAADELALRPEAKGMVSELIALAEGPDANVRQAACRALGGLKDAAALPVLGKRLSDPDTWVRAMAARALKNFGAAAGPQVNTMLAALAANAKPATPIDWSDPLQFSNGFLAQTVFGTALAKELSAAPKDLLYPAIRAGLELPTGFFRGAAAVALRDNLAVADIQALAPEIFEAIREQAPADRMFAGGPPAVGMNAMAKYLVKEGIELSVANGQIGPAALEVLPRYGDAARWTLPMLQEKLLEWDPKSGAYTGLVNCIESIRNATTAPPLVSCLPVANPQVVAAKEAKLVTLTGVAPDNGPLTFAIIEEPAHGTLSGTPPSVTYTPADGYQGTDRFTFKVTRETTREKLESPPGTVSLIVGAVGTGLRGEYVKSGKRIAKRVDPTVDFDWSKLPDAEKIDSADIKIQWTGEVLAPETGTYVFSTLNAGGVRLWVNGLRVINDPKDRPARWTDGAPVNLVEGQRYDVKLACFKKIPGPAMMKLKWTGPSFAGKNGVTVGQEWLYVSQAESKPDTPPEPLVQQVTTSKDMPKVIVLDTGWNATEPLAYEITTKPAHGSLGGEPPTLTYTPAQGFVGDDRFTYRITRGKTSLPAETVGIAVLSADPGPAVTSAAGKTAPPAAMLSFGLPGQPADFIGSRLPGQRDDIVGSRVIWPVPSTATLENLAPVFTLAPGMTCDRASGSSNDFSTVQTYGVTDAEGEETLYQVLAAKVVIDAGATQKITDEKQLGSPAVIMKGGTINPIAPLTPKTTIILAPGTSNTIDSSPGAHEAVRVTCTITGEGSLVVAGDRSVYMSNTPNDYTGGTRITLSSGARFLVDGNRQFGTGLVTFAGTGGPVLMSVGSSNPVEVRNDLRLESDLVYSQTYNNIPLSLKGDIKGPGSLTKTFDPNDRGTRLVLLGKNSTYSGGTIFRSGYLDVLGARSLGSGPVTMGGKASPEHVVAFANMSPMTLANNVVLAGITEGPAPNPEALAEFLVSQHLELAGGISGTGGLLKTGPKTLTLSGVNTATGPTRIEAGELAVLGPISLGSGSLEIADGAKIRLNYEGTRRIAALSVAGKALPPGTYGSAASPATNKDDKHFSGTGTVTVQ